MVQTRAAAKRIQLEQVHGDDQVLLGTVESSPIKKQRRDGVGPTRRRRCRGKPGELCQLNLDVLFLLAAYIHPIDLLSLARTCKSLRELLMDKSSEFVWKTARLQAKGLPDCPADLTEPEYANLVFYARCHGCGKYAKTILWRLRRRYCPDCRLGRLYPLYECDEIIMNGRVLAMEHLTIIDETSMWVDKEQMNSFMDEYNRTADKNRFLSEKKNQYATIDWHARKCISWEQKLASERRYALELRRKERENTIFECLKRHGFELEIQYFGCYEIQNSNCSVFKTSKRLTDKEWTRMWPEWLQIMNNFRTLRLEKTVYRPRRELLASEYAHYVACPSPDTPTFDLLPNLDDLGRFPPFQDIIKASEGTQIGDKPFESAFAQLPVLVDAWRKKLDSELAELVKIPSHLSFKGSSKGRAMASSSTTRMRPSQAATHKLHLACAVFTMGAISTYPDVLHSMHRYTDPVSGKDDLEHTFSIGERFDIKFLEDAPYIVHACGFDPSVASVEDMDRRNARLKCLVCKGSRVSSWKDALRHARYDHQDQNGQAALSKSPRWEAVGDEHIDAIRAAELCVKRELPPARSRCLLCRPCAGDAMRHHDTVHHLWNRHNVEKDDIKPGVHYVSLDIYEACSVEMIEEGGQVMFKYPIYTFMPRVDLQGISASAVM